MIIFTLVGNGVYKVEINGMKYEGPFSYVIDVVYGQKPGIFGDH